MGGFTMKFFEIASAERTLTSITILISLLAPA